MRKPKPPTKAEILAALQKVFPQLREHPVGCNSWHLPTIHGSLFLHPADGAIRTHFHVVPEVEPSGASLNPYSGKWNFEGVGDNDALIWAIGKILNITARAPS